MDVYCGHSHITGTIWSNYPKGLSVNSFTVSGWCKFFEKKFTSTGKCVSKFQVSVMNPKPKDGGKATYTHVRCVAWDLDVDLEDGQEVIVHGDFFSKTYEAKDGTKKPDFGLNVKALGLVQKGGTKLHQASTPDPVSVAEDIDEPLPF